MSDYKPGMRVVVEFPRNGAVCTLVNVESEGDGQVWSDGQVWQVTWDDPDLHSHARYGINEVYFLCPEMKDIEQVEAYLNG